MTHCRSWIHRANVSCIIIGICMTLAGLIADRPVAPGILCLLFGLSWLIIRNRRFNPQSPLHR